MIQRTLGATALLLAATSLPAQDDAQVVAGGTLTHVELDVRYAQRWSLVGDITILARTVVQMMPWVRSGAY